MRKLVLSVLFILTFFIANYAESATTSDGVITLDYYEDTLSGIENRWILDMTVNDIDGPGGLEEIYFNLTFYNTAIDFDNMYNQNTEYYVILSSSLSYPAIASNPPSTIPVPVGSNFLFYAMPEMEGNPVIGDFYVKSGSEYLQMTGPVAFNAVPEPITMFLFAFGAFLLKFISRKK